MVPQDLVSHVQRYYIPLVLDLHWPEFHHVLHGSAAPVHRRNCRLYRILGRVRDRNDQEQHHVSALGLL